MGIHWECDTERFTLFLTGKKHLKLQAVEGNCAADSTHPSIKSH